MGAGAFFRCFVLSGHDQKGEATCPHHACRATPQISESVSGWFNNFNITHMGEELNAPLVLAAIVVLALSGCAPRSNEAAGTASATTEASAVASSEAPTTTATATATPTPEPAYISYTCQINDESRDFTDFQDVWATKAAVTHCDTEELPSQDDGELTVAERTALAAAYGKEAELDNLRILYSICAQTAGIPIDNAVSLGQAEEAAAAITLCPKHPKINLIKKVIATAKAEAKVQAAIEVDRKNGKFLVEGSYLVGKEAVPGTWQSQGERVTDCYWEVSDGSGNIMANNFINVAPQFTITVPADAAGLTITGCSFRWVGP